MSEIDDGGPAFPQPITVAADGNRLSPWENGYGGMSQRTLIATELMNGLVMACYNNPAFTLQCNQFAAEDNKAPERFLADTAVLHADALLAALAEPQTEDEDEHNG